MRIREDNLLGGALLKLESFDWEVDVPFAGPTFSIVDGLVEAGFTSGSSDVGLSSLLESSSSSSSCSQGVLLALAIEAPEEGSELLVEPDVSICGKARFRLRPSSASFSLAPSGPLEGLQFITQSLDHYAGGSFGRSTEAGTASLDLTRGSSWNVSVSRSYSSRRELRCYRGLCSCVGSSPVCMLRSRGCSNANVGCGH